MTVKALKGSKGIRNVNFERKKERARKTAPIQKRARTIVHSLS
jgi:hypothetical protein